MRFWLLILSILVVRRLVVMIRKILRYYIDTIIGIVVLLGLSITKKVRWIFPAEELSGKISDESEPKTVVKDM